MNDLEQWAFIAGGSYLGGLLMVGLADTRFGRRLVDIFDAIRDGLEAGLALLGRLVRGAAGKAWQLVRSRPSTPPAPTDTIPAGSVPLLVEGRVIGYATQTKSDHSLTVTCHVTDPEARARLAANDTKGLSVSAQRWGKTAAADEWLASQLGHANPTTPTNQA